MFADLVSHDPASALVLGIVLGVVLVLLAIWFNRRF